MNRRDRSRSPNRSSSGRRRDRNQSRDAKSSENNSMPNSLPNNSMMNSMMMNSMYNQGNMLMSGMYPNMMMQNPMMGNNMIPTAPMDMMQGSAMEMMPQNSMDVTMPSHAAPPLPTSNNDMPMMGGMMMDPSLMPMYSGMGTGNDMPFVEKKEITLKHCRLIPPPHGSEPPPCRVKPPGCRTIFIGGLPDKARETHVREIFECYGRISTLRLSTKNFCHIRFEKESSVDMAMHLSGYQIKMVTGKDDDDKDDSKATTGWLHVDYALSRDDQNDYERRQRQVLRAQEVQMQQLTAQQKALAAQNMGMNMNMGNSMDTMGSYHQSPSPPTIHPYSHGAIAHLAEKIKSEEHFAVTVPTLVAWLERGECSKKNATQFYSMLQATNSHIRRLFGEKMQAEEELQETKEKIKRVIQSVIEQLEQVAKVFAAATHQRVWDHFTKPQRKNIETWQRMTQEFAALKEEFNEKFNDDDYNGYNMNTVMTNDREVEQLKMENSSLKFQLEAYKNEVDVLKADAHRDMEKIKAQIIARQALQDIDKNPPLPLPIKKPPPPPPIPDDILPKAEFKESLDAGCGEAKLIGVMSAFLQVHPHGASLDYVVSYVRALFPIISQTTVHNILQKHPDVFQKTTSGVGANIEHRWSFIAFQKQETA